MKKQLTYKVISAILTVALCMANIALARAAEDETEPGAFYAFNKDLHDSWMGENEMFDFVVYDDIYEAMALKTYNLGWAGRFGGVAIKGVDLDITVSPDKNRYIVISVMPDEICTENAFDLLKVIYYKTESEEVLFGTSKNNALEAIHGASSEDFTKIIVDLAWEEEFSLGTLRLDMFSSALEKASSDADGADCGMLYINYIAFFDTLEAAESFKYPAETENTQKPSEEPEETAPQQGSTDGGHSELPVATDNTGLENGQTPTGSLTNSPDPTGKTDDNTGSGLILPIVICVVIVLAAAAVIIFIFKKKK